MAVTSTKICPVFPKKPKGRVLNESNFRKNLFTAEEWCISEAKKEVDALFRGEDYVYQSPESLGFSLNESLGVYVLLPPPPKRRIISSTE